MTLHNLSTTLTPAEHRALHNVVTHVLLPLKMKKEAAQAKGEDISGAELRLYESCEHASLWLAAQSEKLFTEWNSSKGITKCLSRYLLNWCVNSHCAMLDSDWSFFTLLQKICKKNFLSFIL